MYRINLFSITYSLVGNRGRSRAEAKNTKYRTKKQEFVRVFNKLLTTESVCSPVTILTHSERAMNHTQRKTYTARGTAQSALPPEIPKEITGEVSDTYVYS